MTWRSLFINKIKALWENAKNVDCYQMDIAKFVPLSKNSYRFKSAENFRKKKCCSLSKPCLTVFRQLKLITKSKTRPCFWIPRFFQGMGPLHLPDDSWETVLDYCLKNDNLVVSKTYRIRDDSILYILTCSSLKFETWDGLSSEVPSVPKSCHLLQLVGHQRDWDLYRSQMFILMKLLKMWWNHEFAGEEQSQSVFDPFMRQVNDVRGSWW